MFGLLIAVNEGKFLPYINMDDGNRMVVISLAVSLACFSLFHSSVNTYKTHRPKKVHIHTCVLYLINKSSRGVYERYDTTFSSDLHIL